MARECVGWVSSGTGSNAHTKGQRLGEQVAARVGRTLLVCCSSQLTFNLHEVFESGNKVARIDKL